MSDELPLYEGADLQSGEVKQLGDVNEPLQAPDVSSDVGLQSAVSELQAVGSAIDQFAVIRDFGESQRLETFVRDEQSVFEHEFMKRASLEAGSEYSFYDKDGAIIPQRLDKFTSDFRKRLEGYKSSFIHPESRMHASGLLDSVIDGMPEKVVAMALKNEVDRSRKAFDDNYSLAIANNDWESAWNTVTGAVNAGLKSEAEGKAMLREVNVKRYEGTQAELSKKLEEGIYSDAYKTRLDLVRGRYDDLETVSRARYEYECEQFLAAECRQKEFTPEEQGRFDQGELVKPRYDVRNGATEQEYKWRECYNETGTYSKFEAEIEDEMQKEVRNAPVPKDEKEADRWVDYMRRKWADSKTGYGVKEDDVECLASQKMASLLGLINRDKHVDVDAFLGQVGNRDVLPGYTEWLKGRSAEDRAQAQDRMNEARARVDNAVRTNMAKWRAVNPDANYGQEMEQLRYFLRVKADEFDDKLRNAPYSPYAIKSASDFEHERLDERVRAAVEEKDLSDKGSYGAIEQQRAAHDQYKKEQDASIPKFKPVKPKRVDVSRVQSDDEAVFLPEKQFKLLQKKFGDKPVAQITLPGSKAFREVPVRPGQGGQVGIADSTMVRLNNVKAQEAMLLFKAGKGSMPVPDEQGAGAPPDGSAAHEPGSVAPVSRDGVLSPL